MIIIKIDQNDDILATTNDNFGEKNTIFHESYFFGEIEDKINFQTIPRSF